MGFRDRAPYASRTQGKLMKANSMNQNYLLVVEAAGVELSVVIENK